MYNSNFDFIFYIKLLVLCNFIYQVDYNKNYKSKLTNKKILKILKKQNFDSKILDFIDIRLTFTGKYKYLHNSDDLECMLYHESDSNDLYVIFNSTEFELTIDFLKDISTFVKLKQHKFKDNIKLHSGYYNILFTNKIIYKIFDLIKNSNFSSIYIIGYSSGSALATICSYLLSQEFPKINFNLITFASIKVGNKDFVNYMKLCPNVNITSISNSHDLVPILPPLESYSNFDNIVTIKEKKIKTNSKINLLNNYNILDHSTMNFINNIYQYIKYKNL